MLNPFSNHDGQSNVSELHVLGIGSPFGDDQLGFEVVKLLQQKPVLRHFTPEQLHIAYCDRPGMYLLELMKGAQTVFLIDAVKTGAPIGTLHRFENEDIESMSDSLSTHALGIAEAIKIGAILQTLPQNVVLYAVEIGDVQFQFTLSKPIELSIKALSAQIQNDILSALNDS